MTAPTVTGGIHRVRTPNGHIGYTAAWNDHTVRVRHCDASSGRESNEWGFDDVVAVPEVRAGDEILTLDGYGRVTIVKVLGGELTAPSLVLSTGRRCWADEVVIATDGVPAIPMPVTPPISSPVLAPRPPHVARGRSPFVRAGDRRLSGYVQ